MGDAFEVEGNLGYQNDVGSACDTGMERDPSRIAAHHFKDHDSMVRLSGRMETIDRFRCHTDRTVESNRGRGFDNVVVNGFRYGDERNPTFVESVGDGERPVTANDDERVERQRAKRLHARVGVVPGAAVGSVVGQRVALVRGAQYGSALTKNPGDGGQASGTAIDSVRSGRETRPRCQSFQSVDWPRP